MPPTFINLLNEAAARVTSSPAAPLVYTVGGAFNAETVGVASSARGFTIARVCTEGGSAVNRSSTHDLSAGTLITDIANDVLRVAKTALGTTGALIEPARTNYLTNARVFSGWTVSLATRTLNATTGPDGTNGAARFTSTSTPGNASKTATTPDGYTYTFSAWYKSPSGAKQTQVGTSRNAVLAYAIVDEVDTKWVRASATNATVFTGAFQCLISDARSRAAYGGLGTALRDDFTDIPQLEQGKYPSSWLATAASTVVRTADKLSVALATARSASGRLRWYARFEIPWDATTFQEPANGALVTLWRAGSYHAVYLDSATTLRVQAYDPVGNAYVTSTATPNITFAVGDVVELLVEAGGNAAPSAKWRINGGAVVTATFSNLTPCTIPTSGPGAAAATVAVAHDGSGTQVCAGVFAALGFLADGSTPAGF